MSRSLPVEGSIQHDRMHGDEHTHAREKCLLDSAAAQQAARHETHGDQAEKQNSGVHGAPLHRLAAGLPARRHINLRELHGESEGTDLGKIADPQPSIAAARIARAQKHRHEQGNGPEEDQHIARPDRSQLRVEIIVVVGVESLADRGNRARNGDQPPDAPAKGPSLPRSLPAHRGRDQRRYGRDPVAPQRGCVGPVADEQYRHVYQQKDYRRRDRGRAKL